MSTPAQKKRKKAAKPAATPALSASLTSAPPPAAAPVARAAPLSAIAARRAAAALLAAASRQSTPPPAPVEEPDLTADLQEAEDRQARALIADAVADDDNDDDQAGLAAADHIAFGDEDESSDAYGSSEGEGEDITLQMDGEVISLGSIPRPSKPSSRRQAKPPKGKAREGRISKLDAFDESEAVGESSGRNQSMEVDTPQRSAYGASNSGTPSVADSRIPKKRKGYQTSSSYQGAMSAFLPALGQNVLRLDADRLRDVFSDVEDGETACVILLQSDETVVFSGSCALYPLLSTVSVFGAVLPPATVSPPIGHSIYAPISHPLPVVTPAYDASSPSPYLTLLGLEPEMLLEYACAFLIRERRSGLEGMCRAVGGLFDGVWEGETAGWGVRGFYPILSQTSFTAYTLPPTWQSALAAAIPLSAEEPRPSGSTFEIVPDSPSSSTASITSPSSEVEDDSYGPFTALLKGPKRSGKSGMSRALVNRLLRKYKKVAYLETDLGQSEFGPEGVVSLVILEQPLLGPSFTHPAIPFRAHYFGSSTPRNDPSRYLALVNDLLSAYRLSVQYPPYASTHGASRMPSTSADDRNAGVVPLVINTQGWVKGLGMDLLVRIEQEAEVTDVFEFEAASGGPGDEWEDGGWEASIPLEGGWGRIWSGADGGLDDPYRQSSRAGPRRHFLSPVGGTPLAARWTASDLRLLSLITYFHAQFPTPLFSDPMAANASPLAESWHFDLPLVAHRPWAVDWTKAFTAVYLAGAGAEDIIPSLVWDALAISLVALVAPDDDSPVAGRPIEPHSAVPYEQGRPPPEPASSRCLGLAIVRATPGLAPSHDKTVHLLTPLPARLLSQTTLLVKGETELPLAAMLDWRVDADFIGGIGSVERENVPYIEWVGKDGGVGVIGGGRRKVRRNVGRRQG